MKKVATKSKRTNSGKASFKFVVFLWAACFGSNSWVVQALGGTLMDFSSGTFLDHELRGKATPAPTTSAPTVSNAPSVSRPPSSAPSISNAPTSTPTNSLAPSTSPSEAPSPAPTPAPSDQPTKSPAPSPSPTQAPSSTPSVSAVPSSAPSVSSAPSETPSETPSDAPSEAPSEVPSSTPSVSSAPSSIPSVSPTPIPSETPSLAPSDMPSSSPSDAPSDSPSGIPSESPTKSLAPSEAPSISSSPSTSEPSSVPTSAPTEATFKTKTTVTNVFLQGLDREMNDQALARFELTTLQFIHELQGSTPDYMVDILAVTLLTQDLVFPEAETTLSEQGLQVAFRTVGIVTEGVAPRDFIFNDVTDFGFENYFGEYLYRLTRADDFFEPLAPYIDSTTKLSLPDSTTSSNVQEKSHSNGKFVAAIMFATLALVLATLVALFAIRKHVHKEQHKLQSLEYPAVTGTMSEAKDEENQFDDAISDLSGTDAGTHTQKQRICYDSRPLELKIGDEKIEMEEIGLTPVGKPPGYTHSFSSTKKPPLRPVYSPNGMDRGIEQDTSKVYDVKKSSFGSAFGMKKWLTPRKISPEKKSSGILDLNDPPESEIEFEVPGVNQSTPKHQSMDPDAGKIISPTTTVYKPTASAPQREIIDIGPKKDSTSELNGDARSAVTSNYVNSMIDGSTASSFFSRMARRKNGTFLEHMSNLPFEAGHTNKPVEGLDNANDNSNSLSAQNLAKLQTNSSENVEATILETGSTFEERRSIFERGSATSQSIGVSHMMSSRPQQPTTIREDEAEAEVTTTESKRRRTFEADSVYSEQSELDLNQFGIETTLGALPPKYEHDHHTSLNSTFAGHEYGSRPNDAPSHASDGVQSKYSKPSVASFVSRDIIADEEQRRISLNMLIKQKDTYDVFAPPGPIGIVVDTSKMGPAVHSLKSTSPMLGLINPGDLIVALDGEDTRNMTAASLTRLMAKKSRQKERKITLLSCEDF